jgi:probable HAF family extracellular repeat protein
VGQVVGTTSAAGFNDHAFVWTPTSSNAGSGEMVDLGTLLPTGFYGSSHANAINDQGMVVGDSLVTTSGSWAIHAFLWDPHSHHGAGAMIDLGVPPGAIGSSATGINAVGQIVGTTQSSNVQRSFLFDPEDEGNPFTVFPTLPSAFDTYDYYRGMVVHSEFSALGINDAGLVIGHSFDANGNIWKAALWTPLDPNGNRGTFSDIGFDIYSYAASINASGEIAGPSIIYNGGEANLYAPQPCSQPENSP